MSSIIFGKKYLNLKIGSLSYSLNTKDLTSYLTIPLPQTVGKKPFGLTLLYNLDSDRIDDSINLGKGGTFSHSLTFQDVDDTQFNVIDCLGNKRVFIKNEDTPTIMICEQTGETLYDEIVDYKIVNQQGGYSLFESESFFLNQYLGNDGSYFVFRKVSKKVFRYTNNDCAMEFISTASNCFKAERIDIKQITNGSNRINYQVFLTYDSNNYLSQIEYKEGSTTLEKYTFTRTTSTITIEDVLFHKKLVITTSGQTKTISSYVNNVFIGTQSITKETLKSILTNAEGKKTEYGYNVKNLLEYEVNENGWVRTHQYDQWNREVETSRTLQIFSHKTLSENLLENGNFSSGLLKYDVDGNATFLDTLVTTSILDNKFAGEWCCLTPLAGKSIASISQTISKSGHKGDPFTAVLLGYKNGTIGFTITLDVYFYDELNQCIGNYYKSGAAVQGKLTFFTLSVEAPGEFSKIKVAVSFSKNQNFYMKELGLYEIGVGKRITYGYHGAVRKVQTGNEEVRTTMDQSNRLLSLTSSSFSGDLVEEYNDKNQPTKSVDIFGNTIEMEYDEDGEIISQRIQCVNVYSVSKRTISYNYGTITTKTTTEIDTRDQTSVEVIEVNSNSLKSYLDPLSKKEEYGYNAYHDLIKVKESKDGTTLREQNITYNANRQIQKVVSGNGSQIEFDYNNYGLPDYIYVDDANTQVELYAYENDGVENQPKTGRISYKIYGDNNYIESYTYNENGQLLYVEGDKRGETRTQREYKFTYDGKERLTHVYGTNNKLIKVYSYTPEDDISKIQITQGETIDIIRKENKEGYVVSRMTPNGEHSFEYKSQYDEATRRSPNAVIKGAFQEFFSTFFSIEIPNTNGHYSYLVKEKEDGSIDKINNIISNEIFTYYDGRIPYASMKTIAERSLYYSVPGNNKRAIFAGTFYHTPFKEEQTQSNDNSTQYETIFGIKSTNSRFFTIEKKENVIYLFDNTINGNNVVSSNLLIQSSAVYKDDEWNFIGLKVKVEPQEHKTHFILFINDKNVTKTIDSEIYFNQNIEIVYAPRSSELQGKTKALGGYTGLIAENDDIETNTVQQYIQGVFYHLIAVEKEWKTWKQEAVQTKHTVLGIKETSGLTNWDYFPLSGSVTSVKGNRDVKLTPKEEYYKANNSYYSYDETLRQEVFDAGKCTLCKTIDFPFESGKANILFDFKVLNNESSNKISILSTEGLEISLVKDTANVNQYYVYYNFGNSNDSSAYHTIAKGTWNKFQLGFVRENGLIRLHIYINNDHYVTLQSNSLYSKLNITLVKNTNCLLLANLLYGEGSPNTYETLLKRIRETTETDRLGRVLSTEIEDNGSVVLKKTYTYEDRAVTENGSTETRTSGIISKEVDTYGGKQTTTSYVFDELGRVTRKSLGMSVTNHTFEYDARGFLSQERLPTSLQRYVYEYDNNGNIKTVKYYKNSSTVTPTTTTFTYGTLYKDRLEKVGTDVLEYEETNPLYVKRIYNSSTQVEKMNFTWRGSRLTKLIVNGETSIQYEYNDDGTRRRKLIKETKTENGVSKTIDDVIYSYVGGQLQSETHSKGYQLQYFYGLDGRLSFFIYRKDNVETRYYYRWDLLGITGIIDKDGNVVANYSYDAYGNMQIIFLDDSIGAINPMRYKGYYYDSETKYYWLNSRFYVPSWRRFLSPDSLDYLDSENINGLNLYCYCMNDPLNLYDPTGHSAVLIGLIIGALIGFGTATYIDYQDDGQIFNGSVAWYKYLGAIVLGGAIGAGLGAFTGMSFSATIPTGFALEQTSAGTMALVATGSMTLTVSGAQILGVAGLLGTTYMFAKGGLPNNKHQNQQWAEAMKRLGIENRDLWRRLHNEIQKYPYNTHDNLRKLVELLKEILKKWGKL
ncbi:rhs family protein [Coprobacillus sp. CAG:826]|nr:rhs family protein [Coprobacillus sp. CAG:826]